MLKNNYFLLVVGIAIIVVTYFYYGSGSIFSFVPITDLASILNDVYVAVGYILGAWMIYYAIKKLRKAS